MTRRFSCDHCGAEITCASCLGTGTLLPSGSSAVLLAVGQYAFPLPVPCLACRGTGWYLAHKCLPDRRLSQFNGGPGYASQE